MVFTSVIMKPYRWNFNVHHKKSFFLGGGSSLWLRMISKLANHWDTLESFKNKDCLKKSQT